MSQDEGVKSPASIGQEYYEDDEQQLEMFEVRPSMAQTEAWQACPVSELQTDSVGPASLEWNEARATEKGGTIYIIELGKERFIKVGHSNDMRQRIKKSRTVDRFIHSLRAANGHRKR